MREESWVPANPAPLGLAGFGITTLVLSLVNSNLVGGASLTVVLGLALAYGGLAQLLAGMWEFRTGNTFGAVAFTSYGAFWISFYFLVNQNLPDLIKTGAAPSAVGAYLWAWALVTFMLFLCSFKQPPAVILVFLALTITFALLAAGWSAGPLSEIGANTQTTIHAGGFAGLVTAGLALYAATGGIMRHQYGRSILPFTGK
ncbi:MAG: acetate uptake transporter [Actinomycetota bacterium]|nr:acetate uptake transporter [Actinomycetota bacterium]